MGFWCLCEPFCPASTFVTADSDDARNPQHFIYVTVAVYTDRTMRYLMTFLILVLIFGCNNTTEKSFTPIAERIFLPENSLSSFFDSLRIPSQKFIIHSKSDTLIQCEKRTKIFITKNAFVDENGFVPDTIELEIVEVHSISDILRTNLQTVSNGNILQTGGMLFIDAKSNGKPLKINDNSSIFVESPSNYFDTGMQLYDGEFQDNGHINWTNERLLEKSLISIPLELLDYNFCSWECWYSNKQIEELKNPNHENTFIATREFELRMCMFASSTCDWAKGLDNKIINIYIDNIEKDLSYSDSLVADYILNTYGDKIDTTKKIEFDINDWFTYMYKSAIDFSKQKLTKPLDFVQLGVSDSTTIDDLLVLGYTKSKSQKILAQYKLQKQLIIERDNKKKTQQLVSYAFEVNNLGWINIDALLDVENMKETDFTVQVKSTDSLNNISISLLMPDYNVSILAIHQDSMRFSFTKRKDGYGKLPINSKAIIIGLSYSDGLSYFGKQEIEIPENGDVNLVMEQKGIDGIKTEINNLIK